MRRRPRSRRYRCGGQATIEAVGALIVLMLIFFGLLQVNYLITADMVSKHAANLTARSYTVGFDQWRVRRAAQVATIPMAGNMTFPVGGDDGRTVSEQDLIEEFIQHDGGDFTIWYEYWGSPSMWTDVGDGLWDDDGGNSRYPTPGVISRLPVIGDETADIRVGIHNYPLRLIPPGVFTDESKRAVNISTEVEFIDHSTYYLQ